MIKNIVAGLAVVASLSMTGCSAIGYINGFNTSWQNSAPQVFSGTLSKDSIPGTYEVRAVPSSASLASSKDADLGYDVKFSVRIGDYNRTYNGKVLLSAQYDHSTPDEFIVSNFKIKEKTTFSEMEPYVYVNIWPVVGKKFEHQLEAVPNIVVKK